MMLNFWLLVIITFFGTKYALPHSIQKLKENNYFSIDMYKRDKPSIPTNAGMIVLFTAFIAISLYPLIIGLLNQIPGVDEGYTGWSEKNLAFLLVIFIYAFYGLIDDLLDIGRKLKLILPITFGIPLMSVVRPNEIWFPFLGDFDLTTSVFESILWGDLFRALVIPLYVMVVANLTNMYSGYNGLQSGLSIIVLTALLIKSDMNNTIIDVLPVGAFLGSMLAFWFYNRFPSKVFEGNIGSLLFGSIIGCVIVIQELWWFGFFILIPHTFNFILWIIWLYLMRKNPEEYLESNGKHKKFGEIREDGTLEVPNVLTLKWIPNYYYRLNEEQSTRICYSITLVFCITGLFMF